MTQVITNSELQKHNNRKSLWIVIKNDVYDVTAYLNEHPGGEDPLLDAGGLDATAAFEDVGHSVDARSIMRKYKIGTLAKGESCSRLRPRKWMSSSQYHRNCTECDALRLSSRPSKKSLCSYKSQRSVYVTPKSSPTKTNLPIGRVSSIIVPHQSGSTLKWAFLALATAIIIGVAYKKYVAS